MKSGRLIYLSIMAASLSLTFIFYCHYRLKDEELAQYQNLNKVWEEEVSAVRIKLAKNERELAQSSREIGRLSQLITALEKYNLGSKAEIEALLREKGALQIQLAILTGEKAQWEGKYLALEKKFHSLEELKKAVRVVREGLKERRLLTKIAMLSRLDEIGLRQGNRGFLVRDGSSTFGAKARVRVELEPVSRLLYNERPTIE